MGRGPGWWPRNTSVSSTYRAVPPEEQLRASYTTSSQQMSEGPLRKSREDGERYGNPYLDGVTYSNRDHTEGPA